MTGVDERSLSLLHDELNELDSALRTTATQRQAIVDRIAALQFEGADTAPNASRRFLLIGGRGSMGRLFERELTSRGHNVDILDVDDTRSLASAVDAAEIVIVAVPMDAAVSVVEEVGPHMRADALLCDINSLKQEVCAAMHQTCASEALGLHPMFGPTVHSFRRQKVVVCPVKSGELATWWRAELGRMGFELIETDPQSHDRMMAVVQVLVHFSTLVMGEALRGTGVSVEESLRFTSPIYRLELAFVGRLFAQNPALYAEIEMSNPEGAAARRAFLDAAARLDRVIDSGDRATFVRLFEGVSAYFRDFADEAMELSSFIIDEVVARP